MIPGTRVAAHHRRFCRPCPPRQQRQQQRQQQRTISTESTRSLWRLPSHCHFLQWPSRTIRDPAMLSATAAATRRFANAAASHPQQQHWRARLCVCCPFQETSWRTTFWGFSPTRPSRNFWTASGKEGVRNSASNSAPSTARDWKIPWGFTVFMVQTQTKGWRN